MDDKISYLEVINRIKELVIADSEGRIVILPSRNDEIIKAIEVGLGFKLYDWQKAYIFGNSNYIMRGRQTGATTAYILKLILSEGEPIRLYKEKILKEFCDLGTNTAYCKWFEKEIHRIYYTLSNPGYKLKLRKIYFNKSEELDPHPVNNIKFK